jgi:hypothetical protein
MKLAALIVLAVILAGCSGSVSVNGWQNGFETHVANQANGDVSFLRDPAGDARHKRFAIIGDLSPDKATDVSGAFLGRSAVQGRPWLVFIVASVKQHEVQDIRVAMASDDGGKRAWIWSEENSRALETYTKYRESRWKRFDPVRDEPPISPGLFPPDEDIYRFEVAGNTAWVTELNSGARWTIVLSDKKR